MGFSIAAVIVAAGSSSRMGGVKKEYLPLSELPRPLDSRFSEETPLTVLGAAVSAFVSCPGIELVLIIIPQGDEKTVRKSLPRDLFSGPKKQIHFISGGVTRRASVFNALLWLKDSNPSHVLIHDGARPWIKPELIEKVIQGVKKFDAVVPACPIVETPKELNGLLETSDPDKPLFIKRHLKRAAICTVQTPQAFKYPDILYAHEKARIKEEKEKIEYTDDSEIWGEFIGEVAVIPGDQDNRKITYPEDLPTGNNFPKENHFKKTRSSSKC